MAETTGIEWCDATVNWWIEPRVRTKSAIATAFKLDRKAAKLGRWLKVFSNSMSDFFDAEVPNEWRDEAFAVMALTPSLDWMVLTKRPKVMREYMRAIGGGDRERWHAALQPFAGKAGPLDLGEALEFLTRRGPLPNVWLGVTAENQAMADLRIPDLLATPAAKRFLSVEPMLGPVDVRPYMPNPLWNDLPSWKQPELDWIICGGESGPHARPMHPDWARQLRDQCQAAGVPFFFKQWGRWMPGKDAHARGIVPKHQHHPWGLCQPAMADLGAIGKARAGRLLDGREWNEVPA